MKRHEIDAMFALFNNVIGTEPEITESQKHEIKKHIKIIYEQSKRHDLAHLAASALFDNDLISPEDEHYNLFKKLKIASIYRQARLDHELQAIAELFEKEGIDFLPLKGSVVRNYYPESWMRTCGDIDVLVKWEDLKRAVTLLMEQKGYQKGGMRTHDVSLFAPSSLHVEIHFDLVEEGRVNKVTPLLMKAWDNVTLKEGYKHWYNMNDEYLYLYHVSHSAKHLLNGGCGIRSVLDQWILNNRVEHDAEKRREIIEKAELVTFESAFSELSRCWFEGGNPQRDEIIWLEDFILHGGVYGTEMNHMFVQQQKKGGKFGYALSRAFLPYSQMQFYYPITQKHKWLVPFLQIVRWFHIVLKGGTKRALHELKLNRDTPTKISKTTAELLSKLGL